jgi:hypothetical protein
MGVSILAKLKAMPLLSSHVLQRDLSQSWRRNGCTGSLRSGRSWQKPPAGRTIHVASARARATEGQDRREFGSRVSTDSAETAVSTVENGA